MISRFRDVTDMKAIAPLFQRFKDTDMLEISQVVELQRSLP